MTPSPRYVCLWTRLAAGAAIFLAADAAVFRSALYSAYLEPNSSAGILLGCLRDENRRADTAPGQVVALGDSRMGFKPRAANQLEAETGYRFSTIAMPGSTPRCWYYMLREVDPHASRYAAILVGVESYDDEDYEDLANRDMDIRYVAAMLRWTDVAEFSLSFSTWPNRWKAFRAALLKGFAFRADFQDLLVNHRARMAAIEWMRRNRAASRYHAVWAAKSMAGLAVDWKARTIAYPEGATEQERQVLREVLLREPAPQTGCRGAYLRRWLGRIAERYRGSRTRVIFLRLPRGPVVRPVLATPKTAVVRHLAREYPGVLLMPEHAFDALERCEYFGDPLHLNETGGLEFSRRAAREVRTLLGPVQEAR